MAEQDKNRPNNTNTTTNIKLADKGSALKLSSSADSHESTTERNKIISPRNSSHPHGPFGRIPIGDESSSGS